MSTMTTHQTGTREQWLAARLKLLEAEKELTRRGDELAHQRQQLPWVRIDKEYRLETDEGNASLADLFRGRSQLLVYHFMFGLDYTAGCPSCSSIADGFNGFAVHLANHDVMLWAVSRAPLQKLQAYKRRMGWMFPWASSFGGDFNFDFSVGFTEEQQRKGGIEYNYRRETAFRWRPEQAGGGERAEATFANMCGTDTPTYHRERPGMSAFVLEDGAVYHTYSTYARGLDGLWGMYQWLDRAPKGRNEPAFGGVATTSTASAKHWRLHMTSQQRAFFGVSALMFTASAAMMIAWCASMSSMGDMPMPGGWTMSMAWMRMPGETWTGAAASFLLMWVVMMVAMMLPSLVPALWRYRQALAEAGETRTGRLTALVGAVYFFVWTALGMVVFPLGVALAKIEMRQPALARAVPIAVSVVVLIAGVLQFTTWKARQLACCRDARCSGSTLSADAGTAWRYGLRLGLRCIYCCSGLTAILLVIGVMDLCAMAVVTAAITAERLAPAGERVARAIGSFVIAAALFWLARAAGLA